MSLPVTYRQLSEIYGMMNTHFTPGFKESVDPSLASLPASMQWVP